jgi:hypothetical protein
LPSSRGFSKKARDSARNTHHQVRACPLAAGLAAWRPALGCIASALRCASSSRKSAAATRAWRCNAGSLA